MHQTNRKPYLGANSREVAEVVASGTPTGNRRTHKYVKIKDEMGGEYSTNGGEEECI
jgi:hypothetical protein